ncbi:MAG: Na+/H+ antiporter NhaA [Actinobacteria bacterium]|nr:Na+/H+ antiporter NhaA [Actinomycetota bacterium]NDE50098.1 Na+/H+ antiporter NhaA [Actinomycetota bacterium]NDF93913.1 Na+/H+ antiporter NhaA [Actinomycetota bacterium]
MKRVIAPLRDFLHRESSSGTLILIASALGLLAANSGIADNYFAFLDLKFQIGPSSLELEFTILKSINYLLMTLFFFVVGLEIKRELTSGHLASFKAAAAPLFAAIGGMSLPAIIYLAIAGGVEPNGWAVPVATDIALAVGLLALVGSSAIASLRSFLLALAVIDDIGAILIIALVYSTGVNLSWGLAGLLTIFAILGFRKLGSQSALVYLPLALSLWYCAYRFGIHPTIAGVILGLLTPNIARTKSNLADSEDGSVSVIEYLEHKFHPISSYVIVPIFAFANTGVEISSKSINSALNSVIAWGIFLGLVIGKPLGVLLATMAARKIKIAEYPQGARNLDLIATGSAAGIGFTVAIFIARLAFDSPEIVNLAIFSVIVGSVVSALISLLIFKTLKRSKI